MLAAELFRLKAPEEEPQNPVEHGLLAYGTAALSIFVTIIFVGQLLLLCFRVRAAGDVNSSVLNVGSSPRDL
ncbi:MAG: hypothetical protein ACI944_002024 [Natronomonas sp.]|jgi:hypothetical protein